MYEAFLKVCFSHYILGLGGKDFMWDALLYILIDTEKNSKVCEKSIEKDKSENK